DFKSGIAELGLVGLKLKVSKMRASGRIAFIFRLGAGMVGVLDAKEPAHIEWKSPCAEDDSQQNEYEYYFQGSVITHNFFRLKEYK
ncbi:MAG: hypothetical protein LBT62_05050, partial [Deltaproteobacteria bacterium]|nr:hypothetical protein [Deltaproteobacteria bacterium]